MAHDVFVSHSAKDKPTADAICAVLEAQGIRCWVAPRDIVPGKDWGESIVDAIKGARVMVLVFSTHANDSHQIKREVERAVNKGIPVIPLRIEAIEPTASLEYFLSTPHWLDAFTPPLEKHLQYLTQIIRSIIGGTLVEPASVPLEAKNKPETAEAIKKESAKRTLQPVSPAPSLAGKKRKYPLFAMAGAALILVCLSGWYFGVYRPEQKHQAELARIQAKQAEDAKAEADAEAARQAEAKRQADASAARKAANELAAKQAADAKAEAEAEAARQAEIKRQTDALAAQKAALELVTKQVADAKAEAETEAARQAEMKRQTDALAQKAALELSAEQAAEQKMAQALALQKTNEIEKDLGAIGGKSDFHTNSAIIPLTRMEPITNKDSLVPQPHYGEIEGQSNLLTNVVESGRNLAASMRQAVLPATNNQTRPESFPRATLTKLSLSDFNEIFGLRIGAKTNEVSGLFGNPDKEYTQGGNFHDQDLVWTYPAGGTEDLKIEFNNQTMAIHSITFNEDLLPWLADRSVDDSKLSLLGKPFSDIHDLIGDPTMDLLSTKLYRGKDGLEVDFFCPEYNRNRCSRITIIWSNQ